jgi:hypothetical protein
VDTRFHKGGRCFRLTGSGTNKWCDPLPACLPVWLFVCVPVL